MTGGSDTPSRTLRRDAQARREALILAATACFEEFGYGVALELVAERAGVGRGTLYRNFADREALALAIFAHELDRLEPLIDPNRSVGETVALVVREGARASALFGRIATELGEQDRNLTALRALGERLERLMEPVAAQARARGELADEAGAAELVLAIRMAGGLRQPIGGQDAEAQVSAALRLLLDGLRPR